LAKTHDIPNVGENEYFWTQDRWVDDGSSVAWIVNDTGTIAYTGTGAASNETVCVTTPTN
jgi:hypothetical protein